MSTLANIKADMKTAMKAKEKDRLGAIRMIIAEANAIAMQNKRKDPTEDDVLLALTRGVKQREDSITEYLNFGREEQAAIERFEQAVYRSYLPVQLSESELDAIIDEVIAATGASTKKEMGKVMGALMPKVKGKADGKLISKKVQEKLK